MNNKRITKRTETRRSETHVETMVEECGDAMAGAWLGRSTAVVEPAWEITTFKLIRVSASDKAYTNGVQQIKFKIELAFNDKLTGRPGVPTETELDSLTIAFADESRRLPPDTGSATGWVTSPGVASAEDITYDKGYLSHPGTAARPDAGHPGLSSSPQASVFRYFYVANRGGAAQRLSLCAYVECDDGWKYLTNGKRFDDEGFEHVADHDSREDVVGVTPEAWSIDSYPWERDILSGDEGGSESRSHPDYNPDSVHRYTLSFKDPRGIVIGIRSMVVSPKGMIQWHDKVQGEYRACFTGYAQPGSTELIWDSAVPVGPTALPTLSSADQKQAVIVLVGRQDIAYENGKPNGPLTLTTTDWYGNTNTLKVRFKSTIGEGRWTLVLYK